MNRLTRKTPIVSVCIPTYNGEEFIKDAMYSVVNQTYPSIEIIISDDASTDHTLEVVNNFIAGRDLNVIILNHKHGRIGRNWNHCLDYAQGEYIKFLFQDDTLLPDCIEKMVSVLEYYPEIGLTVSKRDFITENLENDKFVSTWLATYGDLQKGLNLPEKNGLSILDRSFLRSNEIFKAPLNKFGEPSAFMFRRDILIKTGYFNEVMLQGLDYEFCYRVLKIYKICIMNEKLVRFRLHNGQATAINRENNISDIKLFKKLILKNFFEDISYYNKLHLIKEFLLGKLS